MSVTVEITEYGDAAHTALANFVAHHKETDPLRPLTVVVSSNYIGIAARRALAARKGVAAVTFLTPYRLAESLGSSRVVATGKRPVSDPVLAGAVRAELSREPGRFEGVHTHPTTERSLVGAHRVLSEVPASALKAISQQSNRVADVVRVYNAVNQAIETNHSNEQDLVEAAVEAISEGAFTFVPQTPVVVFLPQRTTANQIRLLRTLGEKHELHIIAGASGVAAADKPVRQTVEALGARWSPLSSITAPTANRALSVSDADDEVRHALREVVQAAIDGIPFNRCAVLYGSANPYARIIADTFDAAEIEWFGQSVRTAESSLMGRALLDMLALGDHDFSRHDVFAWLASAPVRDPENGYIPVAAWERASRSAGVVSGLNQWRDRLVRFVDDLNADAERFDGDEDNQWRVDLYRSQTEHATALASFVERLVTDLQYEGKQSWSDIADWCRKLLRSYFGTKQSREGWPAHEQKAANIVNDTIEQIGDLDGVDPNPSVEAFRRALELQLSDKQLSHGTFGQGVLVGPVSLGIGLELDQIIVLGLAEGSLPARSLDDPLLPDRIRSKTVPHLQTRTDKTHDTHRALLAVMAAANHTLFTFPRGDLRQSAQRTPSRWLLDTCEAFDGVRPAAETLGRDTGVWLTEVPSFVAGLRSTTFPAHLQEYDMRAILDWSDEAKDIFKAPPVQQRKELRQAVDQINGRRSARFTRFDGNIREGIDSSAVEYLETHGQVTSAARLELWAKCPHAYFVRYILGVESVEDPEEQYRTGPLEFGKLVHKVLERWISELIANGALKDPNSELSDEDLDRLKEIGTEEAQGLESRGYAGRLIYWTRDTQLFLDDLVKFSKFDAEKRSTNASIPIELELGFGLPTGSQEAVTIDLGTGRTVDLRGAVDRVDEDAAGNLFVIDYKTGSTRTFNKLDEDPIQGGTRLQLLLYALAAQQILARENVSVDGAYWFVTSKGEFKELGYPITAELKKKGLSTVSKIIDGIESGLFPAHPAKPEFRPFVDCKFCEPDGLGLSYQHADWLRKSQDRALLPYIEMIGEDHV